ncbi:MAG: helicase-exonuclease AddAB subunit AddA [Acutalibacteraceae bacterium]
MARNWTLPQKNAIEATGGNILVSAAAGSGKTAVLVERVIRKITDRENPVAADRFLIVTFTRAAAGEMRERIDAALNSLIAQSGGDSFLTEQKMLLSGAEICTIDSFCSSLVRENFNLLDIAPDFKTADEGELRALCQKAVDETMEEMYQSKDPDFRRLTELLFTGRDDSSLSQTVISLYEKSQSFPFPERWLQSLCDEFESGSDIKDSPYGELLLSRAEEMADYSLCIACNCLKEIAGDEEFENLLYDTFSADKAQYEYILELIKSKKWDEAKKTAENFSPVRRKNTPSHLKEDPIMQSLVLKRKAATDNMKNLASVFPCCEADYKEDMEFFRPLVKSLVKTVMLFSQKFKSEKREKKLLDFNDITHAALSLLVEETESGYKKTDLAKSLGDFYSEILIDEYQDTNKAQDMLFTALSKDNLFRVGDVKQSIYGFRQAMPQIFLELKNQFKLFDEKNISFPAKILLGNNFRSRKGVTDIINFIFEGIMSERSGDIEYGDEERLEPSAKYSESKGAETELHLLDITEFDGEENSDELQASYIADRINELINGGLTVKDGEGERKAAYGDFAVLLRSVSKGRAQTYAEVFRKKNIPAFTETGGSFLSSKEISLALNFLRVIDNPKQDVALLSVMMSPVFGFSVDDVSRIRQGKKGDFYSCILSESEKGNKKVKDFLSKIAYYRSIAVCLPASELITEIYNSTGLTCLFDACDKTGLKKANLMLLYDYACTYEASGYSGLSSFIRFIDRLVNEKQDLTGALGEVQGADVVKIMTIHKSKGLEFPVCIISDLAKKFNRTDETKNLIVNLKQGLGILRRDEKTFEQYRTACHSAVKLSMQKDSISEELRVLYVALTRAKERLILVGCDKKINEKALKYSIDIDISSEKIIPYAVGTSTNYLKWIMTALLRHPDSFALRNESGVSDKVVRRCESPLKVVVKNVDRCLDEKEAFDPGEVYDDSLTEKIKEKLSARYKYEALSGIITKRAASEVDRNYIDRDYFASSAPSFMLDGGLTGAQRGIATHTFVQFCDFTKAKENLESEIERLTAKGILTLKQADGINRRALMRFFESDLYNRIVKSENVMREKKFTLQVPVNEVYEGLDEYSDELMMIQGIADCVFLEKGKLVVVDYKTDALNNEDDFRIKYSSQVLLYKKALYECTGIEVKSALLYSFHLGKTIEV